MGVRNEFPRERAVGRLLIAAVCGGGVIRLALLPTKGYALDIAAFESWARALASVGPAHIYGFRGVVEPVDYPPGYLYILWAIGLIHAHVAAFAHSDVLFRMLVKLPATLADFALAAGIFAFARQFTSERRAALAAALVLLAPPTWLDSAYWGQVDAVPAALLVFAVVALVRGAQAVPWLLLTAALLVKPQGIVLVPIFLAWQIARGRFAMRSLLGMIGGAVLAYAVALPFAPVRGPSLFAWLFERYAFGVAKAPHASEGAFTFYTIAGSFYRSDATPLFGVALHTWSVVLVVALLAGLTALAWAGFRDPLHERRPRMFAFAATLALATLFLFATRMHERYLLTALLFGVPLAVEGGLPAVALATLTISFVVNCVLILAGFQGGAHHPFTVLVGHVFSALNVLAYALLAGRFACDVWGTAGIPLPRRISSRTDAESSVSPATTR